MTASTCTESDPNKPDHYTFGPISTERTINLTAAFVATLPTGERVELPEGTVLREGTGGIDHQLLLACARGVVDHDATQALNGPVAQALISALRAACGDSIEDVAMRAGLPREMAPSVERDPEASWAARYTEAMRVNEIQRTEIERLHKALEDSATPAGRRTK